MNLPNHPVGCPVQDATDSFHYPDRRNPDIHDFLCNLKDIQ